MEQRKESNARSRVENIQQTDDQGALVLMALVTRNKLLPLDKLLVPSV